MQENKYLCFNVGNDEFAAPLNFIREVTVVPHITPIPQAPKYVLGFINLRGSVLTIIDLRTKLGMTGSINKDTPTIVVELYNKQYALVVDSVNQVISPNSEDIVAKPEGADQVGKNYIDYVFRKKDSLVLIINFAKALELSEGKLNPLAQAA